MSPRRVYEEKRRFILLVGSSSDDRDKSRSPSGGVYRDLYNSFDGPPRLNTIN